MYVPCVPWFSDGLSKSTDPISRPHDPSLLTMGKCDDGMTDGTTTRTIPRPPEWERRGVILLCLKWHEDRLDSQMEFIIIVQYLMLLTAGTAGLLTLVVSGYLTAFSSENSDLSVRGSPPDFEKKCVANTASTTQHDRLRRGTVIDWPV